VLDVEGADDGEVLVGIRPEGFLPDEKGSFSCTLSGIEVMGRDVSIVSTHKASQNATVRAIVPSELGINTASSEVSFSLKPSKVYLFDKETERRIGFAFEGDNDTQKESSVGFVGKILGQLFKRGGK